MRICIVARDISDNYMGSFEFDQAKALNDFGHEVFVISLDLRSVRRKRKWGVFFFGIQRNKDYKSQSSNWPN